MGALRSFLAELKASPQVQEALAANKVLQGEFAGVRFEPKPTAEVLADLERFVDRTENGDDVLAIEAHDGLAKIVSTDAPMKERLAAFLAFLKPYWRPQ